MRGRRITIDKRYLYSSYVSSSCDDASVCELFTYSINRTIVVRHIILITVDIIDLISCFECTQTKAISMCSTDVSRRHAETTVICRACTCVRA